MSCAQRLRRIRFEDGGTQVSVCSLELGDNTTITLHMTQWTHPYRVFYVATLILFAVVTRIPKENTRMSIGQPPKRMPFFLYDFIEKYNPKIFPILVYPPACGKTTILPKNRGCIKGEVIIKRGDTSYETLP